MASLLREIAERLLIVPSAHTAIFETRFQLEMYVLFHRSVPARVAHIIGTPVILLGVLTGLQILTGGIWAGAALVAVVVAFGLRVDATAAAITAGLGVGLLALAIRLGESSGAWPCLALVGAGGAIQTLSHIFEDVPPPQSGTSRFVPMREWMRRLGPREVVRSTLLTMGIFFWLELWATPRIWSIQVLQILMGVGHRPKLRVALEQRAREIVAHPTSDWRRPRSRRSAA